MALKGDINVNKCISVEWKIKEFFSPLPPKVQSWCSPSFPFSNASWSLKVYPNGVATAKCVGWISACLAREESEIESHEVSCTMYLKASDGTDITSLYYNHVFTSVDFDRGWFKFYKLKELLDEKDKLFPDGVVTFFCLIHLIKGENRVDSESQANNQPSLITLSRDLKELFLSGEGTDVTIKVKDQKIKAHSQVLAARSAVLAPMFRSDMKEKNTGEVDIEEFHPETFKEFLIFLYCGEAENISRNNVIELYSAAEKYIVEELKTKCRNFMKGDMSVDTFCDIISLAVKHADMELINHSKAFFSKNVKSILEKVEWITFAKQYAVEANELVLGVVTKFVSDKK